LAFSVLLQTQRLD